MNRYTALMTCSLCIAGSAALAGCHSALTQAGRNVQLMKADPPNGCKEVGNVTGESVIVGGSGDDEDAKNELRNKAAEQGANYVRLEKMGAGTAEGTAFRCPSGT